MQTKHWRVLSATLVATVVVGKLMPGAWKGLFMEPFHAAGEVSTAAHVLLFAAAALAMRRGYQGAKWWQVLGIALVLAAATESLQHFAIQRHPSLLGVAMDMSGACSGLILATMFRNDRRPMDAKGP